MRCKALQHNYILLLFDNHKSDLRQSPQCTGWPGREERLSHQVPGTNAWRHLPADEGPWGVNDFIRIGWSLYLWLHTHTHQHNLGSGTQLLAGSRWWWLTRALAVVTFARWGHIYAPSEGWGATSSGYIGEYNQSPSESARGGALVVSMLSSVEEVIKTEENQDQS